MAVDRESTIAEQVGARVRVWIRDGTLAPGELYSVQQLADRLEVSRSPVREALLGLTQTGLIEFTRNRGFRIVVPTARDIAEIFSLRLAVEPPAVRRVAMHGEPVVVAEVQRVAGQLVDAVRDADEQGFAELDRQLHGAILRAAGNGRVMNVVSELRDVIRVLGPSTAGRSRSLGDILAEHEPFVDAIRTGSASRAQMAMRRHLVSTGRMLIARCSDAGDEDAWAWWELLVDEDE